MFGFSLTKLVVAAILIMGVWYGFKMMTRIGEVRSEALSREGAQKKGKTPAKGEVEDLVECRRCGAFVSANARACSRNDCPYPR